MANSVKFCYVVRSSEHLNYAKHPMVGSLYRFHVYYHVRRILKGLRLTKPVLTLLIILIPIKIFHDYKVPHDPMRYRNETFY